MKEVSPAKSIHAATTQSTYTKLDARDFIHKAAKSIDLNAIFQKHEDSSLAAKEVLDLIQKQAEQMIAAYGKEAVQQNPQLANIYPKLIENKYLLGLALLDLDADEVEMVIFSQLIDGSEVTDIASSPIYKTVFELVLNNSKERVLKEMDRLETMETKDVLEEFLDDLEDEFLGYVTNNNLLSKIFGELNKDTGDVLFQIIDHLLAEIEETKPKRQALKVIGHFEKFQKQTELVFDKLQKLHSIHSDSENSLGSKSQVEKQKRELSQMLLQEIQPLLDPLIYAYMKESHLASLLDGSDESNLLLVLKSIKQNFDSYIQDPLNEKTLQAAFNIQFANLTLLHHYKKLQGLMEE